MEFDQKYEKIAIDAGPHEGERCTVARNLPQIRLAYRFPVRPWSMQIKDNFVTEKMGFAEYKRVCANGSGGAKYDFWLPVDWPEDAVSHWLNKKGLW